MKQIVGLVVIDMQEGIFKLKQPVHNELILIENINKIIDWAKSNQIKIFYSQHENTTFLKYDSADWEIVKALQVVDDAVMVYKKNQSIFIETELLNQLKSQNITKILVVGLISNGCIKESCLDALRNNLEVILIKDAHSTFYKNAEKVIDQINNELENAGVSLQTTEELMRES